VSCQLCLALQRNVQVAHANPSTCAISVIRIKFLKQGGDFSYENIEGSSWSIAELVSHVRSLILPPYA
jgi:hypothetical protein